MIPRVRYAKKFIGYPNRSSANGFPFSFMLANSSQARAAVCHGGTVLGNRALKSVL